METAMQLHIRGAYKPIRRAMLIATLVTLALSVTGFAQTPDKTKLDAFFDRLAEKNKAMGSLLIAKDGDVLYTRSIGYGQINPAEKKPLAVAACVRRPCCTYRTS
jgi:hypothetical protein